LDNQSNLFPGVLSSNFNTPQAIELHRQQQEQLQQAQLYLQQAMSVAQQNLSNVQQGLKLIVFLR
jgi:hypothetical protein